VSNYQRCSEAKLLLLELSFEVGIQSLLLEYTPSHLNASVVSVACKRYVRRMAGCSSRICADVVQKRLDTTLQALIIQTRLHSSVESC
jgi:hypothetical protein